MATMFCTNCGNKHEYNGFPPNFCSKCGSSISGKSSQSIATKKIQTLTVNSEEDLEDNTDIEELPNLDKLDVEIEMEGGFRAFNLEDLSRNPQIAQARKFKPKKVGEIGGLSPTKYGSTKAGQD